ncbi:dynein regulatory complex protein 12 [Brachyhypopomus gauderio]|uniref:dynein regulatory complex protein 12 n=1 Tax=Brachyhypopomus gauderio TaxID=698409 RepID=UPI0040420FA8
MPPKKRKGNIKKIKKDKPDKGDELVEKYRRSILDVAVLKEQLALQTQVASHAVSVRDEMKYQIRDVKHALSQEKLDMKDITADLSRQYKTLQTDMEDKVKQLETNVSVLQKQLDQCHVDLKKEREDRERMEEEKDARIADLQSTLDNMDAEYEKTLHACLDRLLWYVSEAQKQWVDESSDLHRQAKDTLAKLGFNPLDF